MDRHRGKMISARRGLVMAKILTLVVAKVLGLSAHLSRVIELRSWLELKWNLWLLFSVSWNRLIFVVPKMGKSCVRSSGWSVLLRLSVLKYRSSCQSADWLSSCGACYVTSFTFTRRRGILHRYTGIERIFFALPGTVRVGGASTTCSFRHGRQQCLTHIRSSRPSP